MSTVMIFLPNIFQEDYEPTDFKEEFTEEFDFEFNGMDDIIYEKLPRYYRNLSEWPQHTNLRCWNCYSTFDSRPWFVPLNITKQIISTNPMIEEQVIETHGNFCFAPCVKSYIIKNPEKIVNEWVSLGLLKDIYQLWTNDKIFDIPMAETPHIKKCFSGTTGVSDSEYNKINYNKMKMYSTGL